MSATHDQAAAALRALLAAAGPHSLLDPDRFRVAGAPVPPAEIIRRLAPFLTEERRARIEAVVAGRTYTVATVVEGLANSGNVSAVMRTAEGLGFGAFHVVTGATRFKHSERTSQGADKWLDVWRWKDAAACAAYLKGEGYRIVVTHLDETAVPIDAIDFSRKTALVLGNEKEGASPEMLAHADARCVIPMSGFVQSFNISVAAALGLYQARRDRLARTGRQGDLTLPEQEALRAAYYRRSVRHAEQILAETAPGG